MMDTPVKRVALIANDLVVIKRQIAAGLFALNAGYSALQRDGAACAVRVHTYRRQRQLREESNTAQLDETELVQWLFKNATDGTDQSEDSDPPNLDFHPVKGACGTANIAVLRLHVELLSTSVKGESPTWSGGLTRVVDASPSQTILELIAVAASPQWFANWRQMADVPGQAAAEAFITKAFEQNGEPAEATESQQGNPTPLQRDHEEEAMAAAAIFSADTVLAFLDARKSTYAPSSADVSEDLADALFAFLGDRDTKLKGPDVGLLLTECCSRFGSVGAFSEGIQPDADLFEAPLKAALDLERSYDLILRPLLAKERLRVFARLIDLVHKGISLRVHVSGVSGFVSGFLVPNRVNESHPALITQLESNSVSWLPYCAGDWIAHCAFPAWSATCESMVFGGQDLLSLAEEA